MSRARRVGPEIGESYEQGGIVLLGRDPGRREVREGRPFVGPAGELLGRCMSAAGLRRRDVSISNIVQHRPRGNNFGAHSPDDVARGRRQLGDFLRRQRPNIVVALGNEANWTLLPDQWPGATVFDASGILERRGYLWWSDEYDVKVLSAVHPASLLHGGGSRVYGFNSTAQEMLLTWDLERAREHSDEPGLGRPERETTVVWTSSEHEEAERAIRGADLVACDIEIRDRDTLACVGFAPDERHAYVYPEGVCSRAFNLLEDPSIATCWQNGQFDLYFLRSRCGVRVANYADDSIIAWHCLMPELSGAEKSASGKKRGKRTEKGLSFLASLFANVRFWKDYDFESDHDMHVLNGLDCMVTLEVLRKIKALFPEYGVEERIYEHELALVWPTVTMLERGIAVDDQLRGERHEQLGERYEELEDEIISLSRPFLERERERLEKPHLIWRTVTCSCCRNGSSKREHCTDCAGIEGGGKGGNILKSDLEEWYLTTAHDAHDPPETKDELMEMIPPCAECGGEGQWETFELNIRSNDQLKDLLYRALVLPKRFTNKRLSVDEDSLTSILSTL